MSGREGSAVDPSTSSGGIAGAFVRLGGASLVSMALQLIRGKLAAVVLGPAGVGVFNQLALLWNLVTIGGSLGLQNGIVHYAAEALRDNERAALSRLVGTVMSATLAASMLIAIAGAAQAARLSDMLLHDGGASAEFVALVMLFAPVAALITIYRSLLSAARAVPAMVRAQIASDIVGGLIFVCCVLSFGLVGAVIGLLVTYALWMVFLFQWVRKILGREIALPRIGFNTKVLAGNASFGASNIALISAGNIATIFVASVIIARLGSDANGIYSSAFRLSSVYLAAATATAISYFLPTLSSSRGSAELSFQVNQALRFYLLLLPPLMATIVVFAELVVWLTLTSAFLSAAKLMLLLVPAELFRIGAETVGQSLLARRRVLAYTWTYFVFLTSFVAGSMLSIGKFGLLGVAGSYLAGQIAVLISVTLAARQLVGYRPTKSIARVALLGMLLLGAAATIVLSLQDLAQRVGVLALALSIWAYLQRNDEMLRQGVTHIAVRISRLTTNR